MIPCMVGLGANMNIVNLTPHKVVVMNEPLPRNAAGKLLKTALRDGVANGSLRPTSR